VINDVNNIGRVHEPVKKSKEFLAMDTYQPDSDDFDIRTSDLYKAMQWLLTSVIVCSLFPYKHGHIRCRSK
jgi:hypothetical protein